MAGSVFYLWNVSRSYVLTRSYRLEAKDSDCNRIAKSKRTASACNRTAKKQVVIVKAASRTPKTMVSISETVAKLSNISAV